MRHLISGIVLLAAMAAYANGMGPFFFGAPVIGGMLLVVAVALEVVFWRRLAGKKSPVATAPHG
ncbi:MAG: glycosyl transferase family 39 [Rhodanobacter sp.]